MSADFLIVVQARTGSTRLPGKVLLDLGGTPVLARMIERLRFVRTPARVVVATTTDGEDDAIAALGRKLRVSVFRGHPTDLLDRHYRAAVMFGAGAVVKIPSDCPLIDPAVVDRVLSGFAAGDFDYASNLHPASDPDGNDVEVIAMSALESAWRESALPMEREHTTPFMWERPERFRLANFPAPACAGAALPNRSLTHRWTLDYYEDYLCIRRIFEELYPGDPCFGIPTIIELLSAQPDIAALNARFIGVNWYRDHLHLLKTVDARDTRMPGPVGSRTSRRANT